MPVGIIMCCVGKICKIGCCLVLLLVLVSVVFGVAWIPKAAHSLARGCVDGHPVVSGKSEADCGGKGTGAGAGAGAGAVPPGAAVAGAVAGAVPPPASSRLWESSSVRGTGAGAVP